MWTSCRPCWNCSASTPDGELHGRSFPGLLDGGDYRPHEEIFGELTDLAATPAHAATVGELLARLHSWMARTGAPLLDGAVTSPLHSRTRERLVR